MAETGTARLVLEEQGVQLWHGCGQAFVRRMDLSDAVVIADLPYGAGKYKTDVAFDDATLGHLLGARTTALFGWPEDLAWMCSRLRLPKPAEWITWWAPNKCHPRSTNLMEAEAIAIWGHVPGRERIRRPRSDAGYCAQKKYGPRSSRSSTAETARDGDVWVIMAPGMGFNHAHRVHENEKPVELLAKLVLLASDEGHLIVDPCCGSGTTLEAARKLNRRAIGVELVEKHCETARRRLAQQELFAVGAADIRDAATTETDARETNTEGDSSG